MNWLDIIILVILVISIFTGLKQGLIKGALSLAGLVVGVVLASKFYLQLGRAMGFIPNVDIANVVAFILILVVVMIIANVLAALLKQTARAVMLAWVDYLGGAVFGFLMGAIFMGALLAIWVRFLGTAGPVTESVLAGILLDKFPLVLSLLPGEFDAIRSFFK